ncbi:vancomycin high temperature exclusion protein [Siphonobacter sp. SORGH_AS_0500]|uniref:SanA/YdcF family protein n=1 Tax=Siphonobacter sp. SORGH_AS_0500 TaxID=1864824 RepID=UPI00285A24B9|nr:SanA protein [Siphonobacter sp. SORGH_AS_0500]
MDMTEKTLLFSATRQVSHRTSLLVKIIKWTAKVGFAVFIIILLCNVWVVLSTSNQNYYFLKQLPANDVGLVLGTSKYSASGRQNLFFKYRMEAAALLYHEGKVKVLILSGNNDSEYYNEPRDMEDALVALGVPANVIQHDFAGRRTYDSIVRCREVFKHKQVTVISQPFHNARALFLANQLNVEAVAFAAQDVPNGYSIKTLVREYLARPKAVMDVFFLNPTFTRRNIPIENERRKRAVDDSI